MSGFPTGLFNKSEVATMPEFWFMNGLTRLHFHKWLLSYLSPDMGALSDNFRMQPLSACRLYRKRTLNSRVKPCCDAAPPLLAAAMVRQVLQGASMPLDLSADFALPLPSSVRKAFAADCLPDAAPMPPA